MASPLSVFCRFTPAEEAEDEAPPELVETDPGDGIGRFGDAPTALEAVVPAAHAERLAALEVKVARAVTRSRAPVTLRAYRSDWRDFALWCETIGVRALPATPSVVAAYLAELADPADDRSPAAVSTLSRRLAAIGEGHKAAGTPNPCADELVRTTMAGLRRMLGVAPVRKKALVTADLRAMVAALSVQAPRCSRPGTVAARLRRQDAAVRVGRPRRRGTRHSR